MSRAATADRRPIRIVIADDHPIVRRGLCNIVEAEPDLVVISEAATAEEVRTSPLEACDLLVLDLAMPGAVGLSVLKELRGRVPALPILILSITPEEQFALRALRAGASGYLTKRSAPDQLVEAIRFVVRGGIYLSRAMSLALANEALRAGPRPRFSATRLSERELDVLHRLASGRSATAIAAELGISVKTVSTYRRRLLAKIGGESTVALIRYAIREGIVES
jgi:two-component system, NarL family, invasion response regulator UvrY